MTALHQIVVESSVWIRDDVRLHCSSCKKEFHDVFNRRHHCRLCGDVFCKNCTQQKSLIPPSNIVLQPKGGKQFSWKEQDDPDRRLTFKRFGSITTEAKIKDESFKKFPEQSFLESRSKFLNRDLQVGEEDDHHRPLSMLDDDQLSLSQVSSSALSYASDSITNSQRQLLHHSPLPIDDDLTGEEHEVILYGKGLEQRMNLAREPLRVCLSCHDKLRHLQEELRNSNSNATRYNSIDPTHIRRLLNSPIAFTLGHEIRKAAYTLNNLLPLPKRFDSFIPYDEDYSMLDGDNCKDFCRYGNSDGVRIPVRLLEMAKGLAIMTVVKAGVGVAGFEFGTGLVVSRIGVDQWSPPCAIGSTSASVGAMAGAQISDHVFLLMTDKAVDIMSSNDGSVQLGADIGIAVGPIGRSAEVDMGIGPKERVAPIYTYSQSKGFYAGISLDGKIVMTRHEVNEKFYGCPVSPRQLFGGAVPTPLAAQPLYDALKRCSVYAILSKRGRSS